MKLKQLFALNIDQNRNFGLDLLRCIAILMVMLLHGGALMPNHIAAKLHYIIIDGVGVFFVLSGFLIGGIFIKLVDKADKTSLNFKFLLNFWKRRWWRTLPNYYFVLTLLVLYFIVIGYDLPSSLWQYYLFVQSLAWPHPSFYPEAWSLAIEEWFYLLVPPLILLLSKFSRKRSTFADVNIIAGGIILFVIAFRYIKYCKFGLTSSFPLNYEKQVITRYDSLMYGVIAANIFYFKKDFWLAKKHHALILAITLFAINYIITEFTQTSNLHIPEIG